MKKSLLFIPMLSSLATLPLLIASKCKQEETQEQKDEKLAKKYEKEYIDKQKYVFDDFEQFKMKSEYFQLIKNPSSSEAWKDYSNRNIKTYWLSKKLLKILINDMKIFNENLKFLKK